MLYVEGKTNILYNKSLVVSQPNLVCLCISLLYLVLHAQIMLN